MGPRASYFFLGGGIVLNGSTRFFVPTRLHNHDHVDISRPKFHFYEIRYNTGDTFEKVLRTPRASSGTCLFRSYIARVSLAPSWIFSPTFWFTFSYETRYWLPSLPAAFFTVGCLCAWFPVFPVFLLLFACVTAYSTCVTGCLCLVACVTGCPCYRKCDVMWC